MVRYLLRMMSSWAMVCSVWYLPPMSRQVTLTSKPKKTHSHFIHIFYVVIFSEKVIRSSLACSYLREPYVFASFCLFICTQGGEDAVQFANRVKAAIATQGGLVDLIW